MGGSQLLRTVAVEHRAVECRRPFEAVKQALEALVPALRPDVQSMLVGADTEKIAIARRDGPKLWLFLARDHGALTAADGLHRKAIQYEIGNPLTAERMTRHILTASLYAPLRVILVENEEGLARFEYDLPSSLFGQFGDDRVTAVGQELDGELEAVLEQAGRAPEHGVAPVGGRQSLRTTRRPHIARRAEQPSSDHSDARRWA